MDGSLEWQHNSKQEKPTFFAEVILPFPLRKTFTYRVPAELEQWIKRGSRVIVPFGKRKIVTGIADSVHQQAPEHYEARYLLEVMDPYPLFSAVQMDFLFWMAGYYMATPGEVLNAALPSGLKLNSESRIQRNPNFSDTEENELNEQEYLVYQTLKEQDSLSYSEVSEIAGIKNVYKLIKSMVDKGAVLLFEQVKEKYRPKTIKKIRLTDTYANNRERLEQLIKELDNKEKQQDILLKYLQEVPVLHNPEENPKGLPKTVLTQANLSTSSLNTLIRNGVFETFEETVSRFGEGSPASDEEIVLSEAQQEAEQSIHNYFQQEKPVLLHGVTGSGKTEIYIRLIRQALDSGSQVLYLLPEIALTTQIVSRLQKVFGNEMGIYHSRFSDNERVEIWRGLHEGRFSLVVGVRSSIFLPFDNLGLVIIDEEHDNSYKQFDPAPRYNARDAALLLARKHGAHVLLGTATPSLESNFNAENGKWGKVVLSERYGGAIMPEIQLVDLRKEKKQDRMHQNLSATLLESLERTLDKQEQAILFQNRRGYAPQIQCENCGHIPQCHHCNVSLTYHLYRNDMRCHYCGHTEAMPMYCQACGSTQLHTKGFGTEKLEEELQTLLPEAAIQRMDLDSTRRKYSYQKIIEDFSSGKTNILLGTQMVTKGLDFDRVTLVGILDIDRMIYFPDFRAHEKTYQMLNQVSGRAGRTKSHSGTVLIQTMNPEQKVFKKLLENNFEDFYKEELQERKEYHYPPFVRLIRLTLKHEDRELCAEAARQLSLFIQRYLGEGRVLGPEAPPVDKIRNQFLQEIYIKLERNLNNRQEYKNTIMNCIDQLQMQKAFKNVQVARDVDPV